MEDIKVCRICLLMNVKMFNLHSYSLETYYEVLVGNHNEVENLPKYVCYECTAHLQKFYLFREKCLRGQATLLGLLHSCEKITSDVINKIDKDVFRLTSNITLSQVQCLNITDADLDINNEIKTEPFEVIDDGEYFDNKGNIKRENSCDDLSLLSSVDRMLSSDDEPLSLHKEKKKEMKMKRRKKVNIDKDIKIDREDDSEIKPPREKLTREEHLEKKRLAERLRYRRIKNDPETNSQQKKKEKKKYERKKEKGTIKAVNQMTPSEQRKARQIWREKAKQRRRRLSLQHIGNAPATLLTSDYEVPPNENINQRAQAGQ